MTMKSFVLAMAMSALAWAAAFGDEPAAVERDPSAAALENLLNSRASGSPLLYAKAAETVAEDARAGKILQKYVLAVVSKERNAPPAARLTDAQRKQYFDETRDKIKVLAEKKSNSLAWYLLSLEKNDRRMLKRAAEGGNVQALNAWGTLELTDAFAKSNATSNEVERVMNRSFSCFKKAAAQKDANGLYNLGMCYMNGYGCEADPEKAYECFETSAEMGHPESINNIGGMYRDGIVVERDLVVATRWFAKASDLGNAYGQLNYALALQRGEGVEKDVKAAAELLKAASAQGNPEALNAYGMCFFNGMGVERDEKRAIACFRQSAARGFPPAMDNMADCYDRGAGGLEKSHSKSMVWKVRSRAMRGDRNAAIWLKQNGHSLLEEE